MAIKQLSVISSQRSGLSVVGYRLSANGSIIGWIHSTGES
jgi:hypothetical protein